VGNYAYDAICRRIVKFAFGANARFQWFGWNLIAEYSKQNVLLRQFIYGPGSDTIITTIEADGTRAYHHQDAMGNALALSNTCGGARMAVTHQYCDAFCRQQENYLLE